MIIDALIFFIFCRLVVGHFRSCMRWVCPAQEVCRNVVADVSCRSVSRTCFVEVGEAAKPKKTILQTEQQTGGNPTWNSKAQATLFQADILQSLVSVKHVQLMPCIV